MTTRPLTGCLFFCWAAMPLTMTASPLNGNVPETQYYINAQDILSVFNQYNYPPTDWLNKDKPIPPIMLDRIPHSWGHKSSKLTNIQKKQFFLVTLLPSVIEENNKISADLSFINRLTSAPQWTHNQTLRFEQIKHNYSIKTPDKTNALLQLKLRVRPVPASLALAQAAIESAWGASRFALEGNALFGQWSYGKNIMRPRNARKELGDYGVKSFANISDSVASYMHNLNTNPAYIEFRKQRLKRSNDKIRGIKLAPFLTAYSERGKVYTDSVIDTIKRNHLTEIDSIALNPNYPTIILQQFTATPRR